MRLMALLSSIKQSMHFLMPKRVLEQKMAGRKKSKGWLGWIKKSDPRQCKWAADYLAARQFPSKYVVNPPQNLRSQTDDTFELYFKDMERQLSERARESADSKEAMSSLIKKMRAAWNAQKNRSKSNGRKAYSYVMSVDIEQKLHKLAGDQPINKTLEDIINHEYKLYDNEQKIFKRRYEDSMGECELLQKQIDSLNNKINSLKIKMEIERKVNDIIMKTIKGLYFKVAAQEIMMRKAENISDELTDEEKAEAIKAQEEKMNFFDQHLKAEIASIGMRRTQ